MTVIDKIHKKAEKLPLSFQQEALNFILFLSKKIKSGKKKTGGLEWSEFSLTEAMRGLENDVFPEYSSADLKESWK